jgi:hypothetical protein
MSRSTNNAPVSYVGSTGFKFRKVGYTGWGISFETNAGRVPRPFQVISHLSFEAT